MRRGGFAKWLCLGVVSIILLALQTGFFSRLPLMGGVPLLPAVCAAVAASSSGPNKGAGFGLFLGIISDSMLGTAGFFTLTLAVAGFVCGIAGEGALRRGYWSAYVCGVVSAAAVEALRLGYYFFVSRESALSLLKALPASLLYTLLLALPATLILWGVGRMFERRY